MRYIAKEPNEKKHTCGELRRSEDPRAYMYVSTYGRNSVKR